MPSIKVSSNVDSAVWKALKELANQNNQSISGVLNEAIAEYLHRHRVRPAVLDALKSSIERNRRLGERGAG